MTTPDKTTTDPRTPYERAEAQFGPLIVGRIVHLYFADKEAAESAAFIPCPIAAMVVAVASGPAVGSCDLQPFVTQREPTYHYLEPVRYNVTHATKEEAETAGRRMWWEYPAERVR